MMSNQNHNNRDMMEGEKTSEHIASETENARKEIAATVVGRLLPEPDFASLVAKENGVPVSGLDDEAKQMVEQNHRSYIFVVRSITEIFNKTTVPESELETYATEVFDFLDESVPDWNKRSWDWVNSSVRGMVTSSGSRERLMVWKDLFASWKSELIDGLADQKEKRTRYGEFWSAVVEISGSNTTRPEPRTDEECRIQGQLFLEAENYKNSIEKDFPLTDFGEINASALARDAEDLALRRHDPDQGRRLINLFDENKALNKVLLTRIIDCAKRYGVGHGFSETSKKGFEKNILPALEKKDPQVDVLQKASNVWGMKSGDFGQADFVCHAYCVEADPGNVNQLLLALREIPTASYGKLEQNRKDGLLLSRDFGALRDFIHDQRPLVREVVNAMVRYYESKNPDELEALLPRVDYISEKERTEQILNLANYDKEVVERDTGATMKTIDVLRRLVRNTQMVEDKPLPTQDAELNTLLDELPQSAGTKKLAAALRCLNDILETAMREKRLGFEPNLILAAAYVERKSFQAMQKLDYETQLGLRREEWFRELLRFQELTCSESYDPDGFTTFMKNFDEAESSPAAFKVIGGRVMDHVASLTKAYTANGRNGVTGALWSGNVTHELIALAMPKPASTKYGERHRAESILPPYLKNTGD